MRGSSPAVIKSALLIKNGLLGAPHRRKKQHSKRTTTCVAPSAAHNVEQDTHRHIRPRLRIPFADGRPIVAPPQHTVPVQRPVQRVQQIHSARLPSRPMRTLRAHATVLDAQARVCHGVCGLHQLLRAGHVHRYGRTADHVDHRGQRAIVAVEHVGRQRYAHHGDGAVHHAQSIDDDVLAAAVVDRETGDGQQRRRALR